MKYGLENEINVIVMICINVLFVYFLYLDYVEVGIFCFFKVKICYCYVENKCFYFDF